MRHYGVTYMRLPSLLREIWRYTVQFPARSLLQPVAVTARRGGQASGKGLRLRALLLRLWAFDNM